MGAAFHPAPIAPGQSGSWLQRRQHDGFSGLRRARLSEDCGRSDRHCGPGCHPADKLEARTGGASQRHGLALADRRTRSTFCRVLGPVRGSPRRSCLVRHRRRDLLSGARIRRRRVRSRRQREVDRCHGRWWIPRRFDGVGVGHRSHSSPSRTLERRKYQRQLRGWQCGCCGWFS